jgi:Sulfotransferase domain
MFARMNAGFRRIFNLHHPGRELKVFPDDVFIVSYPKSGNTWTRFLIANLIHPERAADFGNINEFIPDPEALSKRKIDRMPRPRVIKSHQYFDPRYPKILYVVRDPRDVAVSQYHFHRKRRIIQDDFPIERFVKRFIAGETSPYASWGENVGGWLVTRYNTPSFLLVRYEDLLTATLHELSRVASFIGVNPDPVLLAQATERSSADTMRKLEKNQARLWSSTKDTRPDVPFIRSAKAGGWKSELSADSIAQLEAAWGHLMSWLGYELASGQKIGQESGFSISTVGERLR